MVRCKSALASLPRWLAVQAAVVNKYIREHAGRAPWPTANTSYFTPQGRAVPDLVGCLTCCAARGRKDSQQQAICSSVPGSRAEAKAYRSVQYSCLADHAGVHHPPPTVL
jgi:hypothetical protein